MGSGDKRLSYGVAGVGAASVGAFLGAPADSPWPVISWFVPLAVATGVLAVRLKGAPPSSRGALGLLLAGASVYLAASLVWYPAPVLFGHQLPFPSPLDAVYFGVYGIYAVFLVVLLRRYLGERVAENRIALIDSLILTTSLSAVLWVGIIEPNLTNGTSTLDTSVAVLYPGFNLLLFALAGRLAVSAGFSCSVPGVMLLVFVAAELVGDIFYGFQSANGSFEYEGPLMVTWMVSYTALGALAAHPGLVTLLAPGAGGGLARSGGDRAGGPVGAKIRLGLLLVAALVPLGVAAGEPERATIFLAASAVTFALVTYRASLLAGDLREQRRLAVDLDEALGRVRAQREDLARYATIVNSTDDSIIAVSMDGAIVDWNRGAERLYGYTREEVLGEPLAMIISPSRQVEATMSVVAERGHATIESVDLRKDGSTVHTSVTISAIRDEAGAVTAMVGIARDVSDRWRAEQQAEQAARELEKQARQLELLAYRDLVTGLGNRALLRQRATTAGFRPESTALLLLDLDGFKEVNDTLGHAAGDALLLQVGERMGGCVRTGDTVVRLGGDEFAVLLPDAGGSAAAATAERILAQLRQPFVLAATAVQVRGSIGITLGTAGSDLDEMLRNADLAMYAAKAAGRDQAQRYDPAMHQRATRRLRTDTELRDAVTRGEFTVYYQPIVSAASGEVSCVEALVRWDHPQRGVVPPSEFLPAAERTGLIVELGGFVLRTACAQVSRWRAHWPKLSVAVNVSQAELLRADFAAVVTGVLESTGLPPDALHLEITETVLAPEHDITCALESLAVLGVQFSIDDFGTGHSSLSRLRALPVDRLKIDKSFVSEIDDGVAPLLSSIIALAHSLGRTVVAEGVETPQQAAFLIANGCDELQGYLFSRPVAAAHVVPVLLGTRTPRDDSPARNAAIFPPLLTSILEPGQPLDSVLPTLLGELAAISGLETAFVTEVLHDPPRQLTRYACNLNPAAMTIEEGLTVDWGQSLCRRMIEDRVVQHSEVGIRYSDVEVATRLGIETYVSIPVYDRGGTLRGTLCAASSERTKVQSSVIGLMELFARVMAERIAELSNKAGLLRSS
jgi:diguanylate cyclase (GGDEF)-like protein/PAS domain S-box-containing protein